jgi:hypothetical protein
VSILFRFGVLNGRLVKESGQVPVRGNKECCRTCCIDLTASLLRKAYVVVEVKCYRRYRASAAFGELSAENLDVVTGRVARLACAEQSRPHDDWFVSYFENSFCRSDVARCGRSMHVLCDDCVTLHETEVGPRFVLVKRYRGPFRRRGVPWLVVLRLRAACWRGNSCDGCQADDGLHLS